MLLHSLPCAALADLVRTLEEKEANSGMRVVVEVMLRRFNDRHFAGHCSDRSCTGYLQALVQKGMITPVSPATNPPLYVLLKPYGWSKTNAIEHYNLVRVIIEWVSISLLIC
jgi:hypothetical protein